MKHSVFNIILIMLLFSSCSSNPSLSREIASDKFELGDQVLFNALDEIGCLGEVDEISGKQIRFLYKKENNQGLVCKGWNSKFAHQDNYLPYNSVKEASIGGIFGIGKTKFNIGDRIIHTVTKCTGVIDDISGLFAKVKYDAGICKSWEDYYHLRLLKLDP